MNDSFTIGFLRTLWILRDYLHEIIVGGGWAPFLYYRYLFQNRDYEPVRTRDIDLLLNTCTAKINAFLASGWLSI